MIAPDNRRLLLGIATLAILGAAFIASLFGAEAIGSLALHTLDHLHHLGPLGWLGFVILQMLVAMVGFVPASLLGLAAGAIYGVPLGFVLSAIGVLLGAIGAFGLARSTLRRPILRLLARHARFSRFDTMIAGDGWRLVLLMRISPVMPFSITSFTLGLSGITVRAYCLGTLASLPALLLYVVLGALGAHSIATLHHGSPGITLALLVVGIAATGLLTLRIGRLIARGLRVRPEHLS